MRSSPAIRLTASINRILWPRLQALGFHLKFPEDGPRWKERGSIVRTGIGGRQQSLYMGRDRFGGRFGILVARELSEGWDYLDLRKIGLTGTVLSYQTQAELEEVLERVANAIETHVIPWLDEAPATRALSAETAKSKG